MFDIQYESQTELLLNLLPALEQHPCFALKGGTAINFFVRDMPRVSVDIDLTYLPLRPREEALEEISKNLQIFAQSLLVRIDDAYVREHRSQGHVIRVTMETPRATIKIEPNTILRGSIYPTEDRDLVQTAQHDPVLARWAYQR
jgi:predicted nucleotidyltransferase component of viral defense system